MPSHGPEPARRQWMLAAGAALAIGACHGTIGPPGAGPAGGTDDRQPGSGGRAGGAGGGGTGGGGTGGGGAGAASLDRGRVVMRRLNRVEYDNTVRDLLGSALRPALRFPADNVDLGFDTIGSALAFSPLLFEMMEGAADELVEELWARPATDAARVRVIACVSQDPACARRILDGFARRAYRRPATGPEIDALAALAAKAQAQTGSFADGLKAGLKAVLLSPNFLFRVERSADPFAAEAQPIGDHELATRLSYFLWSSMPDDALSGAAEGGRLAGGGTELLRLIERMLADPRSAVLVQHFAGQWLGVRDLEELEEPHRDVYPNYDPALRAAMKRETELFFDALLRDGGKLESLLLSDSAWVDDRLARHYGLPTGAGASFRRVPAAAHHRGGLLTQGSFLLVTSDPTRTSPVKRGAWVLEHLLCAPPPPPPPNVESLNPPRPGDGTTMRQKLEEHRRNPECASCHDMIDPIGLGLERYDGIGAFRERDNGQPIDDGGTMPDGRSFRGPAELAAVLASDERFAACVMEKVMTYAVGRGFAGGGGHDYIRELVGGARARGGTMRDVVVTAATSEAFRTRRGEAP